MTITASPMTTIARHTVNDVLGTLPRSGIRRLTDQVMGSRDMDDAIQLGFGQPQEATDDLIRKAIIKATDERTLGYTENAGMRVLRDSIATKLAVRNHIETDVESIFVTPGATYGVAVTIGCLINPGDEVLVPDPGYPNFAAAVHHYGGVVKFYQLRQDTGFVPDLNELAALISPATKALIINSPGNPTGAVIDAGMMEQLVRLTRERGLWLVSDEVYETYVYGCRHVSPLSLSGRHHRPSRGLCRHTTSGVAPRITQRARALYFLRSLDLSIRCAPGLSRWRRLSRGHASSLSTETRSGDEHARALCRTQARGRLLSAGRYRFHRPSFRRIRRSSTQGHPCRRGPGSDLRTVVRPVHPYRVYSTG